MMMLGSLAADCLDSIDHLEARSMSETLLSSRNLAFELYEVLDAEALTQRPRFADHNRETFDAAVRETATDPRALHCRVTWRSLPTPLASPSLSRNWPAATA